MPEAVPEWITATKRAVARASDAVQAHQELTALTGAVNAFDGAIDELAELGQAGALGRGQWWHGVAIPFELRSDLDAAGRELESRKLTPAVSHLETFVKKTRRLLEQAWRDHVRARTDRVTKLQELVDVLSGGGHLAAVARDLKHAREALDRLRRKLPDADAVRTLNTVVAQYDAFESALKPAVKVFVSAVARGGASIRMVDAEVIAWLTGNGALDNFKIVAGTPPEVAGG